jgi:predicted kinase
MNKKCFILMSAPGAGKSTLAKQLAQDNNAVICSADDFHVWWGNGVYDWSASRQKYAHDFCKYLFLQAVSLGKNVIVDNTNLKYNDIKKYIDFLLINNNQNEFIYSIELVEVCYNDIKTAISLRSNRIDGKNIPESKMMEMQKSFKQDVKTLIINDFKGKICLGELDLLENSLPWIEEIPNLPGAIICDLDGTLSIFEYTSGLRLRSPYDASKADCDIICKPVAEALRAFYNLGYEIIFLSGREDKFREPTLRFLESVSDQFQIKYLKLLMRATGDFRKDSIVKKEIYEKQIKNNFNILCVFDDRKNVVSQWRELGLYVFDCNYRGVEF